LEKLGLVTRSRQEQDERNLFVSLTEAGEALKEEAVKVPGKMAGCVNLSADELIQLKQLLDKALNRMEEEK
ncbi:MAG: MarR family transcriptional regulator, partial [Oscillospiraceae bacterium]|nr:MarR family transcriptional regulator [Oscillospiraceae bacterium]